MNKREYILLTISVLFLGLLATCGSFAYLSWINDIGKNVVFNTSKELREYINYDEGESTFVGDFAVSDSYLDGIHSTIAISKKEEVNDITLTATINMDVNAIGTNMASSTALKWVVTSGDSTNPGEILSSGNFIGINSGETMMLLPSFEVTTTNEQYTIWIWLDENENPSSSLTGETLDTVVWTEINQTEGLESVFEITKLTNNYQILNATVVNNTSNVVAYAITTDNVEPLSNNVDVAASPLINKESSSVSLINLDEWIEIPTEEQNKIYNFKYIVSNTGTYYLWFRDANDKVVSNSVTVGEIYTDKPICSWGEFEPDMIKNNETSAVTLTCTGDIVGNTDLTMDDVTLSNNYVTLSNIEKSEIDNGYGYTFTLIGTNETGTTSLTLSSDIFKNMYGNGNDSVTSSELSVINIVTINFNGNMFSTTNQTINGLTITYDAENSYLTLNGTPTLTDTVLNIINGISFIENEKYTMSITYISGNYVYTGENYKTFNVDIVNASNNVSTRNYVSATFPTNNYEERLLTINSSSELEGNGLKFHVWVSEPSKMTFTNYKIKVNFTKNDTKELTYGSKLGALPTTYRNGYTLDGWYTGENGTGTKITESTIVPSEDTTYYAHWQVDTYTVNFNGNMFSTTNQTINGVTVTYDAENSYLTLNGTPTNSSSTTVVNLNYLMGLSFEENDKYNITITYLSGNYTYTGTYTPYFVTDIVDSSKAHLSTRNFINTIYPTSGSNTNTLTISSLGASSGSGIKFWLWASEPLKMTFTNYKIKVNFTKNDTKELTYGSTLGTLPTTYRNGYTLEGWYNGENGTGTKITETTTVPSEDTTYYAKWVDSTVPTASISTTSTLKKTSQTATLTCTDGVGVTSYYWGTSNSPTASNYTFITSTTNMSLTKSVTSAGTYYLFCKDAAGNVSTSVSKTYYTYKVNNMLNTVDGSASSYTTSTYSTVTNYTYIAPSGTNLTTASIYTIPTGSSAGRIAYYSVGEPSTTSATTVAKATAPTLNANSVYTMWFNRNLIYINYKTNGGTLTTTTTTSDGTTTYTWATNSSGLITRSTNGGTATANISSYKYGDTTIDLPNYNYSYYLKITKTGYNAVSGAEWICESGCTTANRTFSHSAVTLTSSDDMCNASSGNCTIVVKVNWIDNIAPTGSITATIESSVVSATVTASDSGSGLTGVYNWVISTSSTCDTTTTGFVSSLNTNYNFTLDESGTYYVCVKVEDNSGNVSYIKSDAIKYTNGLTYEELIANYSCSNASVGNEPIFTYTGNCEITYDDDDAWKLRLLSTGNLTFNQDIYVEAFLVGAGGAGVCGTMSNYDTNTCPSGGGGYHTVLEKSISIGITYTITVGQANGGSTSAFDTTVNGGGTGTVTGSAGIKGSGGSACYEFEESTGDIKYSGVHSVSKETPPANTGRGGVNSGTWYGSVSGSSGIVILRGKESSTTINYNNNGGSGCTTKYIMTGDAYGELCEPTRNGYAFLGWYTSTAYTTEVKSTDIVSSSGTVNLYAYWTENMQYSCSNSSYGSNPEFTYTGKCELIQDENPDDWRVRFLSNGNLTFNSSVDIDAFLVGAGGSAICKYYYNDGVNTEVINCANGGGGYHTVIQKSLVSGTSYSVTLGNTDDGSTSAFNSSVAGGNSGYFDNWQVHHTGAGGASCYEFEESTGDIIYSGQHFTSFETPPANTGRGAIGEEVSSSNLFEIDGSSGIVVIRNQR